jgi:CopG family nickel-responsive transcriptional regulator
MNITMPVTTRNVICNHNGKIPSGTCKVYFPSGEINPIRLNSVISQEIVLLFGVFRVMTLERFGVSVPSDLLEKFDTLVRKRGYVGRSEAIRDAMRAFIAEADWKTEDGHNVASLNIVYTHKPKLMSELLRVQHESEVNVVSTVHIHISRTHCLEVITMKGKSDNIERLSNRISGLSGVDYARLFTFSVPDDDQSHSHKH